MEKILLTYKYAFLGQLLLSLSCFGYFLSCLKKTPSRIFLKLSCLLLLTSYVLLTFCFAISDFSLKAVVESSSFHTPFIYKISGVWGNAAGSFLLWIVFISFSGFIVKSLLSQRLFAFHMIGLMILQWAVFSPFETVQFVENGQDLNPLLQDRLMVFHPPILYLGQAFWAYIYFKNFDEKFSIQSVQLFISIGFFILTLGVLLGSAWAYYELGWGGFWYWDPVEVISLWAWILYLYAFHGLLKGLNISFILGMGWPIVLVGMACVRSGLLASVHSFAENQFFIQIFSIIFLSFIFMSCVCAKDNFIIAGKRFMKSLLSSMSWLTISILSGGIFLCLIMTVFIPIFNPYLYFSPIFYQYSVWPLLLPIFVIMSLKPYFFYIKYKAYCLSFMTLFAFIFLCALDSKNLNFISSLTIALCGFGSICSVLHLFHDKTFSFRKHGMAIGHLGWFLLISSAVIVSFKSTETVLFFNAQNSESSCKLDNESRMFLTLIEKIKGTNFIGHKVQFTLKNNKGVEVVMAPMLKYFKQNGVVKSEMALKWNGFSQHGLIIEKMDQDLLKVRYYNKIGILGVWFGGILLLVGLLLFMLNKHTSRLMLSFFNSKFRQ